MEKQMENMTISKIEIDDRVIENISESGIRKTDTLDNLECFCADNPPSDDFERKIRGCVFNQNNCILQSLPYSYEYIEGETSFESFQYVKNKYQIYKLREGSVIRVFYENNKWYTTTHRKLDAFKSKWGNTASFGEIFERLVYSNFKKSLDEFYTEYLETDKSYVFFIGTDEITRIVSPVHNNLYLIACLNKHNKYVYYNKLEKFYQENLQFNNKEEILNFVKNIEFPFIISGLLLFDTETLETHKIFNKNYYSLTKLRNNMSSIKAAYLENRSDKEKIEIFKKLYYQHRSIFDECEKDIKNLESEILSEYKDRYIFKKFKVLPKFKHIILCEIHSIYENNFKILQEKKLQKSIPDNSKVEKVNIETVRKVFQTTKSSNLNKLINERRKFLNLEKKNQTQ